jgi:hypothetical protein
MKIYEILEEGVNDQFLYHGVPDGQVASAILKSGFIKPNEVHQLDRKYDDDDNIIDEPDVISLSRDQYLRFPYGNAVAQFVIDRDALKRAGIKVKPAAGVGYGKSEKEERVWTPIPVKAPFVVAIQYDPELKIPPAFLKRAAEAGVKIEPWRKEGRNPSIQPADPTPQPQNKYTDIKKLKIHHNGYTSGIPPVKTPPDEWYIGYNKPGGFIDMLTVRSRDKNYIQKLYPQIKDRVAKGLSFDDLLPATQQRKDWKRGRSEVIPGDPDWQEPPKNF